MNLNFFIIIFFLTTYKCESASINLDTNNDEVKGTLPHSNEFILKLLDKLAIHGWA